MSDLGNKIGRAETKNVDPATVASFGHEWETFDQSALSDDERKSVFQAYFRIFPWEVLPRQAEGFDMGCGSGRWASLVAPRVGKLNCIDASETALAVARRNLRGHDNVVFFHALANTVPLTPESQDFGYSLGVLHHIPDTESALRACVDLLKPGAPFLVYIFYRFDNRPWWFRRIWQGSEFFRAIISRLPGFLKPALTDVIALFVYFPLARFCLFAEKRGLKLTNFPLYFYRDKSLYSMRTDSRDRFGTPLERRFTRNEIVEMMKRSGLEKIAVSESEPYWCALGRKVWS